MNSDGDRTTFLAQMNVLTKFLRFATCIWSAVVALATGSFLAAVATLLRVFLNRSG